jgi:hypothetical protein
MKTLSRAGLIAAFFAAACVTPPEVAPQAAPAESVSHEGIRYVFYVLHGNAEEIADTLKELLEANEYASSRRNLGFCALMTPEFWAEQKNAPLRTGLETRIVADARTNSIIIHAHLDELDDMQRMSEIIQRLDIDFSASPAVH